MSTSRHVVPRMILVATFANAANAAAPAPTPAPTSAATPATWEPGKRTLREALLHPPPPEDADAVTVDVTDSLHGDRDPRIVEIRTDISTKEGRPLFNGGVRIKADPAIVLLPSWLAPPVRVVGHLEETTTMSTNGDETKTATLVATSFEKLAWPKPESVAANEIRQHRAAWDEHFVEVTTVLRSNFEIAMLGPRIWLRGFADGTATCAPPSPRGKSPVDGYAVRVRGLVHAAPNARYGHLGSFDAEIVATDIVYLDPTRPECR